MFSSCFSLGFVCLGQQMPPQRGQVAVGSIFPLSNRFFRYVFLIHSRVERRFFCIFQGIWEVFCFNTLLFWCFFIY